MLSHEVSIWTLQNIDCYSRVRLWLTYVGVVYTLDREDILKMLEGEEVWIHPSVEFLERKLNGLLRTAIDLAHELHAGQRRKGIPFCNVEDFMLFDLATARVYFDRAHVLFATLFKRQRALNSRYRSLRVCGPAGTSPT